MHILEHLYQHWYVVYSKMCLLARQAHVNKHRINSKVDAKQNLTFLFNKLSLFFFNNSKGNVKLLEITVI